MSFKKMAAQYELTNIAKSFADVLSKIGTTRDTANPATKQDVTNSLSKDTVDYLDRIVRDFNSEIDKKIPTAGPDGTQNENYIKDRSEAGKVSNLSWKVIKTIFNFNVQGESKPKTLLIDFYIDIFNRNTQPFSFFLKNGPSGSRTSPIDVIQNLLSLNYHISPDKVRVYVNGIMAGGSVTSEELNSAIKQRVNASVNNIEKTASRKYLEKLSKKKIINKSAFIQDSGSQTIDKDYARKLTTELQYRRIPWLRWILGNKPSQNGTMPPRLTPEAREHFQDVLRELTPKPEQNMVESATPSNAFEMEIETNRGSNRTISPYVTMAQQKLKELGYYWGDIDGKLGPITANAIKRFQDKYHGLPATGNLDTKTLTKLMNVKKPEQTNRPAAAPAATPARAQMHDLNTNLINPIHFYSNE